MHAPRELVRGHGCASSRKVQVCTVCGWGWNWFAVGYVEVHVTMRAVRPAAIAVATQQVV